MVKLNISNPQTGLQKVVDIDDERALHAFMEKRIAAEVPADSLGDSYKGYVFKITGGYDKQGFAMKQGVLVPHRVRLLLAEGSTSFTPRRNGQRRRKSVRGCITSADMSMINLAIVKKGDNDLAGLTDGYVSSRRGPKRASNIRKLFALEKNDDVRKYVIRRTLPPNKKEKAAIEAAEEEGEAAKKKVIDGLKKRTRAPKIQRLVTPVTLQRKRHRLSLKKRAVASRKAQAADYAKLLAARASARRESQVSSRRSQIASQKEGTEKLAKPVAPAAVKPSAAKTPATAAKKDAKAAAKAPATKAAVKTPATKAAPVAAAPVAAKKAAASAAKPAAASPKVAKAAAAPKAAAPKEAAKPAAKAAKPAAAKGAKKP